MQSAMRPRQVARVASLAVWALVLIWGLTDVLPGYAQEVPIVPYLSTGYRYMVVSQGGGPAGFEQPGFNDSSWAMGNAAFGSQFGSFSFCPLDPTARTFWPTDTDILLRKTFTLPADASNVRVAVAIDNDIQVVFNGVDISGGLQQSDFCAVRDRFIFPVPSNLLILGGTNLLAVRARDRGDASYVDVEVRARTATPVMPDELILTPPLDVNPVGTSHTVTATVLDGTGNPKPGITVRFMVAGSVSAAGSCTTNTNGQCPFTYPGPQLPGADLITAYADENQDNIPQPNEPADTATKAWELLVSTSGHVTGGGHILAANTIDAIAFGFNARSTDSGFSGECTVVDQSTAPKTMIKCLTVSALVQTGNPGGGGTATFFGIATINGAQTTYRIDVSDMAEPGMGADTFRIQTSSGYTAGGVLATGNIQVHR